MHKIYGAILRFTVLSGCLMAWHSAIGAAADSEAQPNPLPHSTARSAASFTGKNGRVSVNGDLVQAKDGVLTVNGIAYGTVNQNSVVSYVVQGRHKILSVNGAVRHPAP